MLNSFGKIVAAVPPQIETRAGRTAGRRACERWSRRVGLESLFLEMASWTVTNHPEPRT